MTHWQPSMDLKRCQFLSKVYCPGAYNELDYDTENYYTYDDFCGNKICPSHRISKSLLYIANALVVSARNGCSFFAGTIHLVQLYDDQPLIFFESNRKIFFYP